MLTQIWLRRDKRNRAACHDLGSRQEWRHVPFNTGINVFKCASSKGRKVSVTVTFALMNHRVHPAVSDKQLFVPSQNTSTKHVAHTVPQAVNNQALMFHLIPKNQLSPDALHNTVAPTERCHLSVAFHAFQHRSHRWGNGHDLTCDCQVLKRVFLECCGSHNAGFSLRLTGHQHDNTRTAVVPCHAHITMGPCITVVLCELFERILVKDRHC